MACGRYAGKQTGECSLFRSIADELAPGDVLVADQYFSGWFDVALLGQRGVEVVVRKHHGRPTDFRTGVRLAQDDHLVWWLKPPRPEWLDLDAYRALPSTLALREFRRRITTPGFRTRVIVVVTTLIDDLTFPLDEIADLFRRRWQAELHLRSLKTTLQMDQLRCLKPHRVRNELRMHLIAYNLLRGVMTEAAMAADVRPGQISFKGALQTVNQYLPMLTGAAASAWCDSLLTCIATHAVDDRPDRVEPRVRKRRPKSYPPMTRPRPRPDYQSRSAA